MEGFFCYLAVIWHLSFYIPLSTTPQFSMTFRQPGFISVNLWNKKRKLEHVNYMQCHRLQFSSNIWKVVRFSVKYMCMWESGNQHYVLGCDTEGGFYRVWRYEDLERAETKMKIWGKKIFCPIFLVIFILFLYSCSPFIPSSFKMDFHPCIL